MGIQSATSRDLDSAEVKIHCYSNSDFRQDKLQSGAEAPLNDEMGEKSTPGVLAPGNSSCSKSTRR